MKQSAYTHTVTLITLKYTMLAEETVSSVKRLLYKHGETRVRPPEPTFKKKSDLMVPLALA